MPVVDRRDFGGRFSVSENSKRLSNYRYLEIQLMEMIGGWSHTTPQLAFKATFGYDADDEASLDGFRARFHQLLYGEVETTDRMGKMLAEFPELPWEMRLELAHQMWDEARHIEIVAKVVEDELGGELGYGPWSLVWWWMQNDDDPLRRLTVTNCWAERDLMRTLRQWRREAEERGFTRIAELCDYLQADERMHVRLATDWIRRLAGPEHQDELVRWGREAVARIEGFYAGDDYPGADDVKFTFMKDAARGDGRESIVIGE